MQNEGADIIDIEHLAPKPNANEISIEEEKKNYTCCERNYKIFPKFIPIG